MLACADVCLSRRILRDINERGRTVESVLAQYLTFVKPAYHSFIQPSMVRGGQQARAGVRRPGAATHGWVWCAQVHAHFIIPNAKENRIAQALLARDVLAQIERKRSLYAMSPSPRLHR
jgi:hypothetical protein